MDQRNKIGQKAEKNVDAITRGSTLKRDTHRPHLQAPIPHHKHIHRKKVRNARVYGYGFATLLLLTVAFVLMASWDPRISITHILITGNSQLEKEIVQNEVRHIILRNGDEMVSPNTTFTVNIRLIESELRYQFPQLKTVSVSRHLLNTLRISITDRAEYFVWCVDTTQAACYATDETGYIFKRRPSRDDFYVSGGIRGEPLRQTLSRNTLASILATKEHLPKMHVTPIHITVSDDNTQLSIQLAEGPYILFPITKDPEKNISLVQNVFSSEHVTDRLSSLAYIDVRFGNRVFLKPHEHITETEEIAQELEE